MSISEKYISMLLVEAPLMISNKDGTFLIYKQDDNHILEVKKEDGSVIKLCM